MKILNFQDNDYRGSFLVGKAVAVDHEKAAAAGLPRYYVEDGWLLCDTSGKKVRLQPFRKDRSWIEKQEGEGTCQT